MADITFIHPRLATGGGIFTADDVQAVVQAGITHVIDCRIEYKDAPLFENTSIKYLWNGTADDGQPKPASWFSKSFTFALGALSHRHHRVHAHCAAGVNRGPSTAYGIMRAVGFSPVDAEQLIRAVRPQVQLAYKADADLAIAALHYD